MVVVQDEAQKKHSSVDPLVDLAIKDFSDLCKEAINLDPNDGEDASQRARIISMNLCDSSRQIVFRLHRVAHSQLVKLIKIFLGAVNIIDAWNLDGYQTETQKMIQGYSSHIKSRADLLQEYVK